jgi:hypothetical protein
VLCQGKKSWQCARAAWIEGNRAGKAGRYFSVLNWASEYGCYRPRYLNIQRLNYLWTIRHSSARIAGNLIT